MHHSNKDNSAQYDYAAFRYDSRNALNDSSYRSNIPYNSNGHQVETSKYNTLDPKYQTAPFTSKPNVSYNYPKQSQRVASDGLDSKNSKANTAGPGLTDMRRLPVELESVQERSIEQSEMTYKGSMFNESARLRGEEGFKFGETEREVTQALNYSNDNIPYTRAIKYNTFSSGFGLNSVDLKNRDNDLPNFKSPSVIRTYDYRSDGSRTLSDSVGKQYPLNTSSTDNFGSGKNTSGSRRIRTEKDEKNVSSFDPSLKPQEFSKTAGSFGGYDKDFGIEYNPSKQPKRKTAADTKQPRAQGEANRFIGDKGESRQENKKAEARGKDRDGIKKYEQDSASRAPDLEEALQQIQWLENKLKAKEKVIEAMKTHDEEVWARFQNVQEELYALKTEQDNKYQESEMQIERLMQKIKNLEESEEKLIRENEELRKFEKETARKNQELNSQIVSLQNENLSLSKKYQQKIEGLMNKMKQIEQSSQILQESQVDVFNLRKSVEDSSLQIRTLENQNEELQKKNELLSKIIRDKEKKLQKMEQRAEETIRSTVDERVNLTLLETSRNYSHKIQKYKDIIKDLNFEIENLKLELRARPTARQHKETEMKLRSLEYELQEERNNSRETRRSPELENYKKIVYELKAELDVGSSAEVVARVCDLISSQKTSAKFNTAVTDMVTQCAPLGYFNGKPSLKESWKFIKKIMEEYMNLKKQKGDAYSEKDREAGQILRAINDYLGTKSTAEIPNTIKNLIREYNHMDLIISKVKTMMNLDSVASLSELERIVSDEAERKK